eukprot:sb/3476062/
MQIYTKLPHVLLHLTSPSPRRSENGTCQVEVPFLHSVCFVFRTKCCVTCLEAENHGEGGGEPKCRDHETDIQVDYSPHSKRDASAKTVFWGEGVLVSTHAVGNQTNPTVESGLTLVYSLT